MAQMTMRDAESVGFEPVSETEVGGVHCLEWASMADATEFAGCFPGRVVEAFTVNGTPYTRQVAQDE